RFFQQLENPHFFGSAPLRPRQERTILEKLHSWKRSLRAGIRGNLRAQFTESPSEHLSFGSSEPAKQSARGAKTPTAYAEVPVLNSQQLVLSFTHRVKKGQWNRDDVDLALPDAGV